MLVVYASKTGNIGRFVKKLPDTMTTMQIITGEEKIDEPCVLITYTTGIGETPKEVAAFCAQNHQHILGVVGSGNRNWGDAYCKAAESLAAEYGFPVLYKFELSGRINDLDAFIKAVDEVAGTI